MAECSSKPGLPAGGSCLLAGGHVHRTRPTSAQSLMWLSQDRHSGLQLQVKPQALPQGTSVMVADREIPEGSPPGNMTGPLEITGPRFWGGPPGWGGAGVQEPAKGGQHRDLGDTKSVFSSSSDRPRSSAYCVSSHVLLVPTPSKWSCPRFAVGGAETQSCGSHLAQLHICRGSNPGPLGSHVPGWGGRGGSWFMGDFRYFCFVRSMC